MPPSLVVDVVSALGPWAGRWDELVESQPVPSPFQRSWWLEAVAAQHPTRHLLVRSGDELIGGLSLGASRRAGITVLTAPGPAVLCADHLDAITADGVAAEVASVLGSWFAGGGQRLLDVRGVVPDSLLHRAVGGEARADDVAPFQALAATADGGFLESRSSSFRRSVRRGRRKLGDLGLHHRRLDVSEISHGLDELRRLHEDRSGRAGLLGQLPLLAAAVRAGAARGEARVDVLASDTEVVAVTVGFVLAGRLNLYQVARSTAPEHGSAGTVLLAEVIEDAWQHGCHEVDLLRGDEAYKGSFADGRRQLVRVRAANGASATALLRSEDAARRVSARLRSRA